jgi:hypothetical protein
MQCATEPPRDLRDLCVAIRFQHLTRIATGTKRGFKLLRRRASIMKIVIIVTAGLVAMLSVAAAADLPRKEPPPVAAAPIGKYPVGKYPVGKYPVGKYPQPVVTKG